MRRSRHGDDGRLDEVLDRLGDDAASLDDDALRAIAQAATSVPRDLQAAPARRPRRLTLVWTIAPVAMALLVGSSFGFGLASSATPTGSAVTPSAGFGFLPLRGWTVVQGGPLGEGVPATATATNVRLHAGDPPGNVPRLTLAALPPRGIVVHASFTTRGDPGEDFKYEDRDLPLRIASARPVSPGEDPATGGLGVTERRIRAGVGSYNVDARVFFGSQPTAALLAAAQRQLDRLVVASERVTLVVRPLVADHRRPVTLYGLVESRRGGEAVDIQARDCGQTFFRGVAGTTTGDGGSWSTEYVPGITTTLRAVWDGSASAPVTVRGRPIVVVRLRPNGDLTIGVEARGQFWRKRALLQRRVDGSWRTVRSIVLTETAASPGIGWVYTSARLRSPFPRGTVVRAVLPTSQARPCFLGAVSNVIRT